MIISSRNSSVSILTWPHAVRSECSSLQGHRFSPSAQCSDQLWGPYLQWVTKPFPRGLKDLGMKLTSHFQLVPKLIMHGVIPSLRHPLRNSYWNTLCRKPRSYSIAVLQTRIQLTMTAIGFRWQTQDMTQIIAFMFVVQRSATAVTGYLQRNVVCWSQTVGRRLATIFLCGL
jgi:hypothetical protein